MKKTFILFSLAIIGLVGCVENPEGKKAETRESAGVAAEATGAQLTLDPAQSKIEWLGKKVTGQHHGTVAIKEGNIAVEGGKLTGGSFVADLNTITDLDLDGEYKGKLETHLKSPDFFDVANHPEAKFVITGVQPGAAGNQVVISGDLTMRGVTKNITFDATVTEASAASFVANADFNVAREDWGVSYTGKADDLISKEFNLKITLVAKG